MNLLKHWQLRDDIHFLNHGSFGATPTVVLTRQRELQDELESDPIHFLAPERELEPKLDGVRQRIARLTHSEPEDIAFVRNATEGVNAVVHSLPLEVGDEIVITDHGYNACNNAIRHRAAQQDVVVNVAKIPFPIADEAQVVDAIRSQFTSRTRLLVIDHVTSPTGLVFPVEAITRAAHQHSIRVLIDGAHAPGMIPVDLQRVQADYYTANHHKWLCAPKASGFLWVRRPWQSEVMPTVISHAHNRPRPGRSRFHAQFDWCGTFDPTPLLCVPTALDFLEDLHPQGLSGIMQDNRHLALQSQGALSEALGIPAPAPESLIGSMVAIPFAAAALGGKSPDDLQRHLRTHHGFELPVYLGLDADQFILRISLQVYNEMSQVEHLAGIVKRELQIG